MRIDLDIPQADVNAMLRKVRAWQVRKRVQIIDLIEDTVKKIEADATSRVPVQSGNLKKKIRIVLSDVANELTGYVVADDFYAKFIELGTSTAQAHPFMLPAYETAIRGFLLKLRAILSS